MDDELLALLQRSRDPGVDELLEKELAENPEAVDEELVLALAQEAARDEPAPPAPTTSPLPTPYDEFEQRAVERYRASRPRPVEPAEQYSLPTRPDPLSVLPHEIEAEFRAHPDPRVKRRMNAHKVASSVLGLIPGLGPDPLGYRQDLANIAKSRKQMNKQQSQLYSDALANYPVSDAVADQVGLPRGTTHQQAQINANLGGNKMRGAERQRRYDAEDRLMDRQENLEDQTRIDQRLADTIAGRIKARRAGKGGGGAPASVDVSGVDPRTRFRNADYSYPEINTIEDHVSNGARLAHRETRLAFDSQQRKYMKDSIDWSGAWAAGADLMSEVKKNGGFGSAQMDSIVAEISSTGGAKSKKAKDFWQKFSKFIGMYVSTQGGKQLTDHEKRLYAGYSAEILNPSLFEGDGISSSIVQSLFGTAGKVKARQRLTAADVKTLVNMTRRGINEKYHRASTSRYGARLLWDDGKRGMARAAIERHIGEPVARVRPVEGARFSFHVTLADGRVIPYYTPGDPWEAESGR